MSLRKAVSHLNKALLPYKITPLFILFLENNEGDPLLGTSDWLFCSAVDDHLLFISAKGSLKMSLK